MIKEMTVTEKEYKDALNVVKIYEKQIADPNFINVGDRVLIDKESEDVVTGISKSWHSDGDHLLFKEGWASRSCCEKIKAS